MDTETTQTVYEAAGGLDVFLRLAHAWHAQIPKWSWNGLVSGTETQKGT